MKLYIIFNQILNYTHSFFNLFLNIFSFNKRKRKDDYHFETFFHVLEDSNFDYQNLIKEVYYIDMVSHSENSMRFIKKIIKNRAYFKLNYCGFYLDMGIDENMNIDFVGQVNKIFITKLLNRNFYIFILSKNMNINDEFIPKIIFFEKISGFKPWFINPAIRSVP